jgi:beta-1,4-mannosyltransferase
VSAEASEHARRLKVGTWPGRCYAGSNRFFDLFTDCLEAAGVEVVAFERVEDIDARAVDALFIHFLDKAFWESQGRLAVMANLARLARRIGPGSGARVVWVVHNLAPHENRGMMRLLWPLMTRFAAWRCRHFLTLSPATLPVVRAAMAGLARKPGSFFWHPLYEDAAPTDSGAAPAARARRGFATGDFVFGYVGLLRPYKGIESLIAAFRALPDADARLLIAGGARDDTYRATLEAAVAVDARIRLEVGMMDDAAFLDALWSVDLFVAPFARYLHSGSLMHAVSAGRPVLTSRTPFAESLETVLGPAWMATFDGPLGAATLAAAKAAPRPDGGPDLSPFSRASVGAALRDAAEAAIGDGAAAPS